MKLFLKLPHGDRAAATFVENGNPSLRFPNMERRVSDTVLFTSENNDIANQGVDTSFFTSEKNGMTNQLASLARRDYFYLDDFGA